MGDDAAPLDPPETHVRILWYFPFARPEEMPLGCAVVRSGDALTLQVVDRAGGATTAPCANVTVRTDLPDVDRQVGRGLRWLISRAHTYANRVGQRQKAVRSEQPDVVHIHYLNRFTDWWSLRSIPQSSLVVSVHDVVPHRRRLPVRVERWLLAATYRRAGALVVHHPSLKDRLIEEFGVSREQVHVVPHQVFSYDSAVASPLPLAGSALLFGALRANKGIPVLLEALQHLPDHVEVTIAGGGDPTLEEALRDRTVQDARLHVEIGFATQARKSELFAAAGVVVLPYTAFASQSGVLHDAYAHGRPVIVTDVGALGETVREDGTGLVVPVGDAVALAEAIAEVLSNRAAAEVMSERASAVAHERSPAVVGPLLRDVYDRL